MLSVYHTSIFNQIINTYTLREVKHKIQGAFKKNQKLLLFAMNLHILVELANDFVLKKQHQQASSIIFADGMFLVWLSKLQKYSIPERISGTDLTKYLLNLKQKVFIIAPNRHIAKQLQQQYSFITGSFIPPIAKIWPKKVNQAIVQQINASRAKILLVGVGPLKQEKWLIKFLPKLESINIAIGVGSALEILSGNKKRAPQFMQRLSLEWLWRIILEPRRLLPRYFGDMLGLIRLIGCDNRLPVK